MIHLLLLLSAPLSTEISLDFLAESDSEWVAPGWEVFGEIEINPLDYVEPMYYGPNSVACQAFEVQADDGSRALRIVICGSDKLVVFQGDWGCPREWELPFRSRGVAFSPNGRYVLVLSEAVHGERRAILANIDEWSFSTEFNPTPDGQTYLHLVTNQGDIVYLYCPGTFNLVLAGLTGHVPVAPEERILVRYPVVSPNGDRMFAGLPGNGSRAFGALDLDGNLLWSTETGEGHPLGDAVASPDGSLAFVSLSDDRLAAISAQDGRILAEMHMDGSAYVYACSSDDKALITRESAQGGYAGSVVEVSGRDFSQLTEVNTYRASGNSFVWTCASTDGYMQGLQLRPDPDGGGLDSALLRSVLFSPDGSPIWASELFRYGDKSFMVDGNLNTEFLLTGLPYAIAGVGDSLNIASTLHGVAIHGIRRVP